MPSPERVAQVIRLFTPIVVGLILVVAGFLMPNFGVLALGAGALGIPGAVGSGRETPA
jgi:ABC-type phosphate/phosphonate transport system permease subunit